MAERGEPLSDRELDVLKRLAAGESNKAIADELSISPFTVKTHLRNIYAKLGVSTRTEAMTVALQQGVLTVAGEPPAPAVEPPASAVPDEPSVPGSDDGNAALIRELDPLRPVDVDQAVAVVDGASVDGTSVDSVSAAVPSAHRWRAVSLALLALLLVAVAAFAFIPRAGAPEPAVEEPFVEEPLGETRWLSSRPLPEARAGRAVASVGLEFYTIGGETADGVTDEVHVFDTRSRVWQRVADKPTPVAGATAVELFGEVYVPGGVLADGQPTAVVEAYSPTQDAWRRIASLPQPVADGLALTDRGFLYLIGGRDESGPLDTVYLYDPGADSWRPVTFLPEARAAAAGGALAGQLYVVGGSDGTAAQSSCFFYDPPADAWDDCPPMLQPRADAGASVLLNKLYVIGGTTGDATGHGEVYDPNSRAWTVLNVPPDIAAWTAPGVTQVETRIYAVGGRRGSALSDSNLIYVPLAFQTYIPAAPSDSD